MLHRNNLEIVSPQGNSDELPGKFTTSFNQYINARQYLLVVGCRENDVFHSTSENEFFVHIPRKLAVVENLMFYVLLPPSGFTEQCIRKEGVKGRKYFFQGKFGYQAKLLF